MRGLLNDERGSTPVEFVLVGVLLTTLTVAVLQLGLAVYVRNVVHDAAVEGAYYGALADVDTRAGAARALDVVAGAVGEGFVDEVSARESVELGHETVAVTVTTRLPLIGLIGIPRGWEVTVHAPAETLD
ncbi:TadE/TadG family type IV pilus assembly protein [Microbacterium dauci]|uniref:Pilus assembly protein n=1 Tax=Microbacterium dauci TaxID=3048008 RepID=A0ABT6ZBL5_9MICO|nr:TadE family protein [Microbacterium sp. LX3-4]MDJ1113543.1 pilus assembly protein [Microbacterium sp. LX3-4]